VNLSRPCAFFGCRGTAQFNNDYCSEHSGFGNHIIRFEVDGKKKTIDSKEIDNLLSLLKKANKFWIVDLTVDENEFVQYAIEKGELEHWDGLEMIESKEMVTDEAFSTLLTKITGDYSGHQMWWSDQPEEGHSEEELDQQEKDHPILLAAGIVIISVGLIGMFLSSPETFLGELVCQGICGLIFLGGAGASTLGRSDTGKFT
jgi:hypothetical protein